MADAPERIWAFEDYPGSGAVPRGGMWCDEQSECPEGTSAYIRADLVEVMEAENQRLRETLEASVAFSDGIADQCGIDMDETAFVIRVMPEGREIAHRSWADVQTSARSALRSTREGG